MMTRLPLSSNLRQGLLRRGQFFLLTGLSLVGLMGLSFPPDTVTATESGDRRVATASSWQGASFPVENFMEYTSPFGYRSDPYSGGTRFHYGLDMAAPQGSYIRNWWAGEVIEVSDNSACGTSVVLQSGNWMHIYCHMEGRVERVNGRLAMVDRNGGLMIYEGQRIPTGARIGRVGMTGRTTGPHLHWGLKYNENWVDPGMVLRAMYDQQRVSAIPRRAIRFQ